MTNQVNNQSIPSTDVIQLAVTMKMTTAKVVETSVTVNNNSPIQDCVHPDDHTQPTYEMVTSVGNQLRFHNQSEIIHPSTVFYFLFSIKGSKRVSIDTAG